MILKKISDICNMPMSNINITMYYDLKSISDLIKDLPYMHRLRRCRRAIHITKKYKALLLKHT